jgi:hypothetical protein
VGLQNPECSICTGRLYGLDVVFDDTMHGYLLEVNRNPSMKASCSRRVGLKTALLHNTLDLYSQAPFDTTASSFKPPTLQDDQWVFERII